METYGPAQPASTLAFFLLLLSPTPTATQDDLIVNTTNGRVRGVRLPVGEGSVWAFLGIPYGKPPVEELRFKAPEPAEAWTEIKDATQFPNSCYQAVDTSNPGFDGTEMWNPNTQLSEDCLYLNVWTPRLASPTLLPVMVWIYGGGFTSGTSSLDLYDGRFLSQTEDMIVVSMNYRLGALGFLSLPEGSGIPGNAGLLDQQLALRWVKDNIPLFGGDSNKVTLFGESAGAGSVGFHLLSPGSLPLFNRAILQSGSPNAPWATNTQTEARRRSLRLAELLGCPTSPQTELVLCLQRADLKHIITQQFNVLPRPTLIGIPFQPVDDGLFLPGRPEVLLQTGDFLKTDILIGVNQDEGSYFLLGGAPGFNIHTESLISRQDFLRGVELSMSDFSNVSKESAVLLYTDWADVSNMTKNRDALSSLVGDAFFNCPVLQFTNRYTEHGGRAKLYLFNHRSSTNPWPEWMGVMHGYEIEFVFGMPLNTSLGYTEEEVAMSRMLMRHWANFARTGNPTIGQDWPLFTLDGQEYATLSSAPLQANRKLLPQQCTLWSQLVPQIEAITDDLQSCLDSGAAAPNGRSAVILILSWFLISLGLVL